MPTKTSADIIAPIAQSMPFKSRNIQIDALRGIAILSVILLHYSVWLPLGFLGLPTEVVSPFIHNGYYGVIIFFVISGYLITSRVLENGIQNFSARRFYLMRFGRIFPCLLLMVCVVSALTLLKPESIGFDPHKHRLPNLLAYAFTFRANRYVLENGSAGLAWDILWSLSVEEVFYLVLPFVVKIFRDQRLCSVLLITVAVIGPIHRCTTRSPYDYAGCFDLIAIGCLTAMLAHTFGPLKSHAARSNLCWLGAGLILWSYAFRNVVDNRVLGPSLVGIGSSLFILGSVPSDKHHNLLQQVLAKLGSLSYELYLFHMPLLYLTLHCARQLSMYPTSSQAGTWLFLLWSGLLAGLAQLISRFYSEPLNRLIRRMLIARLGAAESRSDAIAGAGGFPMASATEGHSTANTADLVAGTAHLVP
ncbi:MAG: acyltransferase [Verrucomicrobia bacterium]|nr:acyltransferase [Verrucomicrobiota bacterium]